MATIFPENGVEVLRRYLPDDLHEALQQVRSELRKTLAGVVDPRPFDETLGALNASQRQRQRRAMAVYEARERFLDVLDNASLGRQEKPPAIVAFDEITDNVMRHELPGAIDHLETFDTDAPPVDNLQLNLRTISTAFTAEPIDYLTTKVTKIIQTPQGPREIRVRERNTLRGYLASARLSSAQIDLLFALLSFLSRTSERTFRLGVMRGEVRFGVGAYEEAILEYGKLLPAAQIEDEEITPRQQFVALRSGFAQLGLGDALFRRFRNPDGSARGRIRDAYNAAVRGVTRSAISPENPLRQQIEQYAAMQTAKLDAELNFLGYRDSYVPILRPATLQALAESRIQAAQEAAQKFEFFKSKADQMQDQLREVDFQTRIKQEELAIVDAEIAKANLQVDIADKQIEQIDGQLDALDTSTLVDIGGALLQAAASASNEGGVRALSGAASTAAAYFARKDDLKLQKEIAKIEASVARRDVAIARLRKQIVETTVDFLGEAIRRFQNRELNPDLYYAAGEAFRVMALRHLDVAILWSYLFERSVAFLRLQPELNEIQLEYTEGEDDLLAAPGALGEALAKVVEVNLPITKFQFLTETYSLRSLYPLEFNRFLQTGRMDFAMSLYELNKRRPGVYRQRIKRVQVELQFPPPSGFTGTISHRGSFLLRDKDTTPEPGAGPFIPSGDQLEQAFAALGAGGTQGVPIGGVIPFLLDVDRIELGPDQTPPDLGDPAPEALALIEGYGPAGDWTLEVENVDLRFITDALLRITYVIPESDEPLANRVKALITAYEQELLQGDALDLISPFSLRQRFPDAFARLSGGQAQLAVARNDFPAGITGLKLKTLVAQALDSNKKGVEGVALELSKPGTPFRLERSTRTDGFSEDLTAEIPALPREQRVDLEGTYALRLVDPGQLVALNDLLVFFIYEFREV